MTDLTALGADVDWPDSAAASLAHDNADPGLGGLGEVVEWLAGVQGAWPAHDFARARTIVFGAGGCSTTVAELGGSTLRVIDTDTVEYGGRTDAAITAAVALADDEIERGADMFVLAVPGHQTSAAIVISILTNTEPVKVLPRGARLSPQEWMGRAVAVRDGRRAAFGLRTQPDLLIAELDDAVLAAAAGFILRAAARRTPVLLDGEAAIAAALIGATAQPRAPRWWRAAQGNDEPAEELALLKLGQRPVAPFGVARGDGTGGALALVALRLGIAAAGSIADGASDRQDG